MRQLHKRMFDEAWEHAGKYRRVKAEPGVPAWTVSTRLATDRPMEELGLPPFTWGAKSGLSAADRQDRYVAALRVADNDNISVLLNFAHS